MKERILIVEDDKILHRRLAREMDGKVYELVWTRSAHEALRRLLDEHFDLLLLHINRSDLDALKALAGFNALHPFRPLMLLTDWPDPSQCTRIFGADAVLEKPFEQTRLRQTVRQLLDESHQTRRSRLVDSLCGWLGVQAPEPAFSERDYEKNNSAR
jgi:DNA-binding response OmpR family regulator